MNQDLIYWTTKTGEKILVDNMDLNHLRNTLKMIIRNINKKEKEIIKRPKFQINGEIAREMIENEYFKELYGDEMEDYYNKLNHF
jgi:predicted AAA+ superfamily ATPase